MSDQQLTLFPTQPQQPQDMTRQTPLGASLELFADALRMEGKSEHTVKAFIADLMLLGEHTGLDTPLGVYTTEMLNDFLHWMEFERGVPCSRKTYARRVTSLKVFFKWLHTLEIVAVDPAKPVLQRSGPAPLSEALTPQQIEDCIHAARQMMRGDETDTRPEFIFRLLVETGIKKGETARLKRSDIDLSNRQRPVLIVRHDLKNVYKERRIEFGEALLRAYEAYLMQYQPSREIFTCTTRNLEYILTDIGVSAGIPFKLSFENLRWTMGVCDLRAGMSEDSIREKMGLSRPSWHETSSKIKQLLERHLKEEKRF
ncbi:MAG: tyrosine-type recombinase/integrase [Anaerolineae bacterium]